MSAIIEFVKEAQGYLFQSDDVSQHLIEAIGERAALTQQVRAAQENYDMLEGGYIFELMTGDTLVATGKNAEQRNAAKDALLAAYRQKSEGWKALQSMKESLSDAQTRVEQNEKRFTAVRIQAELASSILKALSAQS